MSPLAVITAIILGSAVAIGFGLFSVWFLAFWLQSESKQLASELGRMPLYCGLFAVLATVSAYALIGLFKQRLWRWWAQGAMWTAVALIGWMAWLR